LLVGATLVQAGSVFFPNSIVEAIDRHRATSFSGVPEMYRMLLARSDLGQRPLPSLRYMAVAGGPLPHGPAGEIARRIAPGRLFVMYGQTEATARISYLEPGDLEQRLGSVGRGIPGVEVQVVGPQDQPVRPGDAGEVRARGANVMLGYWGDHEGTGRVLRHGWLYTGDLGTMDQDGYLYLQGRASELVKVSGHRVHPGEVEGVVARRLPVQNVAVVACDTQSMGTRLAMFVQPASQNGHLTPDEVLRFCRAELPRYEVPVFVEVLAKFPLTNTMKVDRRALERLAAERLADEDLPRHRAARNTISPLLSD
jgi:acyl-CoA synthetase (AMP-forming)/AMP-acid ligase II